MKRCICTGSLFSEKIAGWYMKNYRFAGVLYFKYTGQVRLPRNLFLLYIMIFPCRLLQSLQCGYRY